MTRQSVADPAATSLLVHQLIPYSPYQIVKYVAENMESIKDSVDVRADLQEQIDAILTQINYQEITITSFTVSTLTAEMGNSISGLVLNWALNKAPVGQTIDALAVDPAARSYDVPTPVTSTRTFSLVVIDENGTTKTATVTINFYNRRYWGVSTLPSLNPVQITELSNELSGSTPPWQARNRPRRRNRGRLRRRW